MCRRERICQQETWSQSPRSYTTRSSLGWMGKLHRAHFRTAAEDAEGVTGVVISLGSVPDRCRAVLPL
jgi:hypothetical protein